MATASALFSARAAAGAAYAAALADFKTKWIALRAYDVACANAGVLKLHPSPAPQTPVYTFGNPSTWDPGCLQHPVFASAEWMTQRNEQAQAAALTHIAGTTAG